MGLIAFVFASVFLNYVASEKLLFCYYGTWATYRWGYGTFDVEHVNPDLCTHLVYAFVGIDTQGNVQSLDPFLDIDKGNFVKFNGLKQQNPKLKTILAVGGWNEGSGKYSVMAANPTLRQNFIQSALKMTLDYGFDGFDLDWEYPGRRDSVNGAADVNNFSVLVKEMKEEFNKYGLLLTAAVSSVESSASLSYDIPEISKYLDLINLMTYDMYGAWDTVTGHNAPLYPGEGDETAVKTSLFTVDNAVQYWLNQGCPPEKLVLGLPLYGRTFTLANAANSGVRAWSAGAGIAGPYTISSGSIGYNEWSLARMESCEARTVYELTIKRETDTRFREVTENKGIFCYMLNTQSWDIRYDSQAKVPYAVQDRNWVSYDDAESITKKVEYGLQHNLAGFMVWSIETDDFHGLCSGEDFPLLRAINRAKDNGVEDGTEEAKVTTRAPETEASTEENTTPVLDLTEPEEATTAEYTTRTADLTETTNAPKEDIEMTTPKADDSDENSDLCKSEGFASDPKDCSIFYVCVNDGKGGLMPVQFECPQPSLWDAIGHICNYADAVDCPSNN